MSCTGALHWRRRTESDGYRAATTLRLSLMGHTRFKTTMQTDTAALTKHAIGSLRLTSAPLIITICSRHILAIRQPLYNAMDAMYRVTVG